MEISEVRVKLVNNARERLKAFCSITLQNDFVVRDLKIIEGTNGTFVAMPSRKLAERCPSCKHKNHLQARFCNHCGTQLPENEIVNAGQRDKLHADIAHPINTACRERIQKIVVEAYEEELQRLNSGKHEPVEIDSDLGTYDDDIVEEPVEDSASDETEPGDYDDGLGYDELISDLRRDAEHRRHPVETVPISTLPEKKSDRRDSGESPVPAEDSSNQSESEPEFAGEARQPDSGDFGFGIL